MKRILLEQFYIQKRREVSLSFVTFLKENIELIFYGFLKSEDFVFSYGYIYYSFQSFLIFYYRIIFRVQNIYGGIILGYEIFFYVEI